METGFKRGINVTIRVNPSQLHLSQRSRLVWQSWRTRLARQLCPAWLPRLSLPVLLSDARAITKSRQSTLLPHFDNHEELLSRLSGVVTDQFQLSRRTRKKVRTRAAMPINDFKQYCSNGGRNATRNNRTQFPSLRHSDADDSSLDLYSDCSVWEKTS
jgi:hypothetical protein